MKIIVFIDQIVSTQVKLQGVDFFDPSKVDDVDLVINPTSKNAIEGALKLKNTFDAEKEEEEEGAKVTAVCVRGLKPIKALREAIAMGCTDAIEIADDTLYTEDPLLLAKIYVGALEKIGDFDLVFLSAEEQSSSSYAVGAMLAEKLGLPSVLYAEEIENIDGGFRVGHVLEGGRKIVEVPQKALISTSDSQYFTPRYTSMKGILNAKRAVIPTWTATDLGLSANVVGKEAASLQQVSLTNIVIEKESYIITEGEPEEMVDNLLSKLKEDEVKLGA
ncbi:MAG: electron transfer flavoprotein subunit beta/FixA family protein [Candidatus Heimdallarchaeota archaeon]|nr:electron transfer flavoprotein subunit beta/FixA family protein [Candidatus Heimdallarchaeota archaeon]